MSILWGTDWHCNFLKREDGALKLAQYIFKENPDADGLVLTGDISSGEVIEKHLTQISQGFPRPVYFVLGNHSFYNVSFKEIDELIPKLTKKFDNLFFLNEGSHLLGGHQDVSLVGVSGWYDAYHGNTRTGVEVSDFTAIKELWAGLNYRDLMIELVRERAKKEADRLDKLLFEEICNVDAGIVLIATHVAPYPESAWHQGHNSSRDWLPWFTSASIGAVIDKYAENHPNKKFVVLCGHSHSPGIYEGRFDNLTVYTGSSANRTANAVYGFPDLAGTIDILNGKIVCYNSSGKKVERPFP